VAQPADKIEGEILPEPELNPLLNPLLAAHMGRWAEVYFTSPPEKRAQAVSDLVRELRNEPPPPQSAPVQPVVEQKPAPELVREVKAFRVEPIPVSPGVEQSLQTCGECSAENPAQQKFCGMCGAALQSSPHHDESTLPSNAPAAIEETREEYLNETQSSRDPEQSTGDYAAQYAPDSSFSFGGYASRGSREQGRFVEDAYLPQFAVESPSVPYRYRLYIGVAVAVILGGLLYMAWHRTPNSSGDTSESVPSRVMPSAPSRATPEPAPQRAVVPTDKASDTAPVRAAPSGAASSAPASTASNNSSGRQSQASGGSDTAQAAKQKAPSPRIVSVASNSANSSAAVPVSTGAEELATAEKYLNGGYQGGARDNREAAQWLWKAVGKGNVTATLLLSDLYLRGDGIPKSCDQARLLLNVAARKGKAAAGERLRNLQAFGCQ
jgi:hypothetical protein